MGEQGTYMAAFFEQLGDADKHRLRQLADEFDESLSETEPQTLATFVDRVDTNLRLACIEYLLPISVEAEYRRTNALLSFARVNELHLGLEKELEAVYDNLPSDLFMPRLLGEFIVQEMLHDGHPVVTANGKHRRTDSPAFLKYVDRTQHPSQATRIEKEFRLLSRLSHPALLRYHDGGRSGRFSYIATDHLSSTTLRDAKRNRDWPAERCAALVARLCMAVHYLHGRGIVHSDIKPDNIMFNSLDEPVLIDFDLASDINQGLKPFSALTDHSGTFPFMAPEQFAKADSDYPQRRDIFALGGVLGWLLTDENPGPTDSQHQKFVDAVSQLPIESDGLRAIILKATEKDPRDRFVNPEVMRLQLEKAISKLTAVTQVETKTGATGSWLQTSVAFVGLLTVSLAAFAFWPEPSTSKTAAAPNVPATEQTLSTNSDSTVSSNTDAALFDQTEFTAENDGFRSAAGSFLKWSGFRRTRQWRMDHKNFDQWLPDVQEVRLGKEPSTLIYVIPIAEKDGTPDIVAINERVQQLPVDVLNSRNICVQVYFNDGRKSPVASGTVVDPPNGKGEKVYWTDQLE